MVYSIGKVKYTRRLVYFIVTEITKSFVHSSKVRESLENLWENLKQLRNTHLCGKL